MLVSYTWHAGAWQAGTLYIAGVLGSAIWLLSVRAIIIIVAIDTATAELTFVNMSPQALVISLSLPSSASSMQVCCDAVGGPSRVTRQTRELMVAVSNEVDT
jgi:hypothetical protein